MKHTSEGSFFTVEERGDVRTVRFTHHQRLAGVELPQAQRLWALFEAQKARPSKVLVIEAPTQLLTPENLDAFWAGVLSRQQPGDAPSPVAETVMQLLREENALCYFIEWVRSLDALVIFVLQGRIDLPFLGLALAGDYRIVADDTVFVSRCLDVGLPPCGALPWFLTRYLGQGKASEILLKSRSIPAAEALELHLVDEVAPVVDLERRVRATAERFASKPRVGLVAAKRSMIAAEASLESYLGQERHIFEQCVNQAEMESGEESPAFLHPERRGAAQGSSAQ